MTQPKVHVSIDLETLGTSPASVILAIGAVAICEESEQTARFYAVCSVGSQQDRKIDQSTLTWWEQQSAEARKVLDDANDPAIAEPLEHVLNALSAWIGQLGETHQVFVIGNGANFDVAILEHAYKNISPFVPWAYWNVRDLRTLKDLATRLGVADAVNTAIPRVGTRHNALDDAAYQAVLAVGYIKAMEALRVTDAAAA